MDGGIVYIGKDKARMMRDTLHIFVKISQISWDAWNFCGGLYP